MKRLFVYLVCLTLVLPSLADSSAPINQTFQPVQHKCAPNKSLFFKIEGLSLSADSGTVISPFIMQASCLQQSELSTPSELINVTDRVEAYRLLPNGEHFSEPATIAIAYNPARLPIGYRPDDIYTFCYDSAIGHWSRLQRVRVDTVNNMVYSMTTHFTEFADFVIQVPEMPESKAFVPTDMQDLPDPDPLTGVPMIEVPKANNMGTAELTYPIPLPPGRHGLQPDLDLHYSSAGGNGLLGVGWSFAQPAITIDTRGGVPRYDLRYESEAYLVNGEPILMHDPVHDEPLPLPHMATSFEPRRAKATRFYPRDQRNQAKVVRHGQLPDRYWWSVITTDGVTYYYGYNPLSHTIDEQSVIRTAKGNIGYWALTAVVDRFGNYVQYYNSKDAYNELLIDSIFYTGHIDANQHTDLPPHYRVLFRYTHRPDTSTDARLGVLKRQTQRLCQIRVRTRDNVQVANYQFMYGCAAKSLFKSRLDSIIKYDTDIMNWLECQVPFSTMQTNHEEWIHNEDQLYGNITQDTAVHSPKPASVTALHYRDAFNPDTLFSSPQLLSSYVSEFSTSRSEGWNIGGAVTVGYGYNPALTSLSAGANYAYERNKGAVKTMLIDLNGDGLLDHLSVSDNTVYYRRQKTNKTLAAPITVSGLNELSRDISSSHTFGVQLDCYGNLSYNPSISTSYTDIYFADINADGLPDLVTPSGVKLNTLINDTLPSFNTVSDTQTALPIHGNCCNRATIYGGEVDSNLMCDVHYERIAIVPLSEIIPSDDGEAQFVEQDMEPDPAEHEYSKNLEPKPGKETQTKALRVDDVDTWDEILSHLCEGDDCYFEIVGSDVYVFRKFYNNCAPPQTEPNVDIVRTWTSDRADSICLNSVFRLLQDTSEARGQSQYADGVQLRIQWNKGVYQQSGHLYATSTQLLYNGTVNEDNYDSILTSFRIRVQERDVIFFRMSARNNRKFDNANWEHSILTASGDTIFNSARDYICTDRKNFVAPAAGTARVSISCLNADTVPVKIRVMQETDTILYFTLPAMSTLDTMMLRTVALEDDIIYYADTIAQEPTWSKLRLIPKVDYWGPLVIDSLNHTLQDTLHYNTNILLRHSSFASISINYAMHYALFGPLHKGFGQFAYNDVQHDNIIQLNVLQNEEMNMMMYVNTHQSQYQNYDPNINVNDSVQMANIRANGVDSYFSSINAYDPLADDKRWVPMHADVMSNTWQAYGNTGTLGQYLHSTSRQLQAIADTTIITEEITEYDSPVPTKHGGLQRVTTIRKSTRSTQHTLSTGFSGFGVGISNTASWGSYAVQSDYMDMNGDGFPDFVGKSAVQYSRPWGGIGPLDGVTNMSSFSSENLSIGKGFSASRPQPKHAPGNGVKDNKMYFGGIGGGISGQLGSDETNISYMDINADGLPDIVDAEQHKVKYNLGYSFTSWTDLPSVFIASATHGSISFNAAGSFNYISNLIQQAANKPDFSLNQFSISGGFSASASENISQKRLLDVNGDGYPDLLILGSNGTIYVRYFDGTSYTASQPLNIQGLQQSNTANVGFNLGITAGFDLVIPVKFCFGVHTTPWTTSSTVNYTDFMDVDGDGYVDQVLNTPAGIQVRYNRNGSVPVNLLTGITNPTGQAIFIYYTLSQPSTEHHTRTWDMVQVEDKLYNTINPDPIHTYYYYYSDKFYDNFEKTDYGCDIVTTNDEHTKFLREYYNNSYYIRRGEKTGDLIYDSNHVRYIGHSHETRYHDIYDQEQSDVCNDIYLHVGTEGYYTDYYETQPSPQITTRYHKFYDSKHNLIRYEDEGDVAVLSDDWYKIIDYKQTTSYNMISLPQFEIVYQNPGIHLRFRYAGYNSKGKPHQLITKDDNYTSGHAITNLQYDNYGNIIYMRDPINENGQWAYRTFDYDDTTKTYVTNVVNQFGENSRFEYDLRHGLRKWSRDAAGSEMRWRYDRMGRLIDIIAPNELHDNLPYSVHYIYRLPNHNQQLNAPLPYTYPHVTKVAADINGLASTDVTIYDARGQQLQKKIWRNINLNYEWVTDGLKYKDTWYRPHRTYDPFITDIVHYPLWEPDVDNHNSFVTTYNYDILDRNERVDYPDLTYSRTFYEFGTDYSSYTRLKTRYRDENGLETASLYSPQGWTIQTITPNNDKTNYEYNPIGELVRVTDADGYQTTYTYDMFGNKIMRDHPDAGKTIWTYAPNGDVIRMQPARLAIPSVDIRYIYNYNRLTDIIYPIDANNNVHYDYNTAGRIARYEDATGSTELSYDALGNINGTTRRIVMPKEQNVYTFRTQTQYDSFGKVKHIIYPDSERVDYQYYQDGKLEKVTRLPYGGSTSNIIDELKYDPIGHNVERIYGNGIVTTYSFEPYRNRMIQLRSFTPSDPFMRLCYAYDNVGNIIRIDQTESTWGGLGGGYRQDYAYDSQYRLSYSTGSGTPGNYDFHASYSPAGRLGHDTCLYTATPADAFLLYGYDVEHHTHQPRVVFEHLHEPSQAELFWDANGNLAFMQSCQRKLRRYHHWDEENRLRMVVGGHTAGFYGYDATGERIYKLTGECQLQPVDNTNTDAFIYFNNATIYPNPYVVVTPQGYTKHYYANGERLATTIGTGGWHNMSNDAINQPSYREYVLQQNLMSLYSNEYPFMLKGERFDTTGNETIEGYQLPEVQYHCPINLLRYLNLKIPSNIMLQTMIDYMYTNPHADDHTYYTHNDHLGSASWITYNGTKPVQYLHYLPYGQLLTNQQLYTYDERFKFIGKERDQESGYDFFGARYYASPFKHFISPEPLLDKYLHVSPYSYAAWNPIKYYDFNGKHPRSGRPGELQNGVWKTGADATFAPQSVLYKPIQMNKTVYTERQLNINKGTLSASPSPKENLLNSLNPFEASMIQSPVIQGVATGVLAAGMATLATEAALTATPSLLNAGAQIQGLALQGISAIESSAIIQFSGGIVNGAVNSYLGLPDNLPSIMTTAPFKVGVVTGQFIFEKGNEVRIVIRPPTYSNSLPNNPE